MNTLAPDQVASSQPRECHRALQNQPPMAASKPASDCSFISPTVTTLCDRSNDAVSVPSGGDFLLPVLRNREEAEAERRDPFAMPSRLGFGVLRADGRIGWF
jgi:hypothetical protein